MRPIGNNPVDNLLGKYLPDFTAYEKYRHKINIVLLISLIGLFVLTIVKIIWPDFLWEPFQVINYPLHSTIEAIGAIAAILIAFMPLEILFGKKKASFAFLSAGFLVMGIWDLFHSVYESGHGFVLTHSIALLSGGVFFALFCFHWKISLKSFSKYLLIFVGLFSVITAIFVSLNRAFFPVMIEEGSFTLSADILNIVAGLLFLVSVFKLVRIYRKDKNLGVLFLIYFALFNAFIGLTFYHSKPWFDDWWLWHIIRLLSFFAVLGYLLYRIQTVNTQNSVLLQEVKTSHDTLLESETRFRLVNEATSHGLWDWNLITNEVYFSPVWKKQVGYEEDELENTFDNWVKLLHPDDKDSSLQQVNKFIQNPEGKFILEFRFRHKNGHYVFIHNEAACELDHNGKVIRMFGAHTDITRQKEIEKKLIENEKQFRTIFENSPLGKSITGLDGSLRINRAFSYILGYSHAELQKKNWKEITHPEDIESSEKVVKSLIAGEHETLMFEKRYLHKNGHYVWTEVNTTLHRDNEDKPKFFITVIQDITNRKLIESQVKSSEEKFRSLFESDPSAIVIGDPKTGYILDVNPAAEKLLEMKRDEIIGMHQSMLHPEDVRQEQVEKFKTLQNAPDVSVTTEVLTKSGKRVQVEIKVTAIEINKEPLLLGIFHDITRLVEKQNQIKQSEEKHRAVFESATDAFIIATLEGSIVEVNPSACKIYGYNYDEMIGMTAAQLIHPDYHHKFSDFIKDIQEKGFYSGETVDVRKDQTTFFTEVHGSVINFNNQKHMLAVIRDISEKKRQEDELKLKDIVFQSSVAANSTADLAGKLTNVNQSFLNIWGYHSKEEVLGKPIPQFIKYENDALEIMKGLTENQKWQGNYAALKKDGSTFIAQANASVLFNAAGEKIGYQSSVFDVTEKVNSEKQLKEFAEKLQRSNKELERFAYVASHDLQEPLRMVSSYTQLLERKYKGKLDEKADKYIHFAVDGANRMQTLINDLLELSRVSTRGEKFVKIDIKQLAQKAIDSLSISIKETNAKVKIEGNWPKINVDGNQIERLFLNLIGNAIKFRRNDVRPEILVKSEKKGDSWLFSVKDNGIGIDKKFSEKIFVVFQRLHNAAAYKGTGIGLAICKQIVLRHGGEIWFESEINKGTTFYFKLDKK